MRALALALALFLCALSPALAEEPAPAPALDAARPMRCALAKAAECDPAASCSDAPLEQIELPDTVRVDFAGKNLVSPDGQRTSPIQSIETFDRVLVLQGSQNGRGWTMVIERATGHLTATIADTDGAFVLSGGCSAE